MECEQLERIKTNKEDLRYTYQGLVAWQKKIIYFINTGVSQNLNTQTQIPIFHPIKQKGKNFDYI